MDGGTAAGQPAPAESRAPRGTLPGPPIALVVQAVPGAGVNLDATTPQPASGAGIPAASGKAISDGGPAPAPHAVLGALITPGSIAAVVRAVRARRRPAITAGSAGSGCPPGAFASGAALAGDTTTGSPMATAALTGAAIIAYQPAHSSAPAARH